MEAEFHLGVKKWRQVCSHTGMVPAESSFFFKKSVDCDL
jgi:hypothetical protein